MLFFLCSAHSSLSALLRNLRSYWKHPSSELVSWPIISLMPNVPRILSIGLLLALPPLATNAGAQQNPPPQPQDAIASKHRQKLVMKDGSSQLVSSYQIQGDRVRYFSVDRSEWEEIPASQIDWPATKAAEAAETKDQESLRAKVKADQAAAAAMMPLDVDASLEVLPGVFLPPGEGFFILDGRAIFPLKQSEAVAKNSKGQMLKRMIVPVPVIPARTSVDLPGRRASFRITNRTPEFYLRTKDAVEPQIELIRAPVKGDRRHIENIDSLFGQHTNNGKTVGMQLWPVAKGVYRYTLGQALAPGEYALAEFSVEGMDLFVWDFGVDAAPKERAEPKK